MQDIELGQDEEPIVLPPVMRAQAVRQNVFPFLAFLST